MVLNKIEEWLFRQTKVAKIPLSESLADVMYKKGNIGQKIAFSC